MPIIFLMQLTTYLKIKMQPFKKTLQHSYKTLDSIINIINIT
jgi:hypothetical protein